MGRPEHRKYGGSCYRCGDTWPCRTWLTTEVERLRGENEGFREALRQVEPFVAKKTSWASEDFGPDPKGVACLALLRTALGRSPQDGTPDSDALLLDALAALSPSTNDTEARDGE